MITMKMRFRGPILLFTAFMAFALHSSAAAAATTNDELLAKLNQLEGVFHQEMAEAKGRIAHLEQENEELTGEFSAAKERISSLQGEVERLNSGLLLLSPLVTSNRRPVVDAAAGGVNDNSQQMTAGDDAESSAIYRPGDHQLSSVDNLHQQNERAIVTPPPTSCAELAQLGNRITGFHLVLDKESNNRIQTVYCDFALAFNNPDYETAIGYNDIKMAPGVSFYVQRNSTYSSYQTVIPYQIDRLNVGGAMNAATGVFTAPANGRYHFSFKALSDSSGAYNWVFLRVNGVKIANSFARLDGYNMPLVATLQLIKGDTVDVYLYQGSIYDSTDHFTQFSGFLLEEDLVL